MLHTLVRMQMIEIACAATVLPSMHPEVQDTLASKFTYIECIRTLKALKLSNSDGNMLLVNERDCHGHL